VNRFQMLQTRKSKWGPYVPPYDSREKHYPGMNYCGPGTNVWKRMRNGVKPVDALDQLCYLHDLDTEPRGPYRSRGKRHLLRASDRRLISGCKNLRKRRPLDKRIPLVIASMELMLKYGARGR
jgi:hypothetical protein